MEKGVDAGHANKGTSEKWLGRRRSKAEDNRDWLGAVQSCVLWQEGALPT